MALLYPGTDQSTQTDEKIEIKKSINSTELVEFSELINDAVKPVRSVEECNKILKTEVCKFFDIVKA